MFRHAMPLFFNAPLFEGEPAKPGSKAYRLVDGDGLHLEVMPSGSKIWRMRTKLNEKEMVLTFGRAIQHYLLPMPARHVKEPISSSVRVLTHSGYLQDADQL